MKISTRSPFLWSSATILSALLYFFAFHFFPQTFPLINLSITMDLEQALDKANEITQKHNLGSTDSHSAAMFHTDTLTKTFVELEAGGKDAFVHMMDEQLYMPYTWRVRHFKEHEKNEVTIIFTPDGKPYGFIETISENNPGERLAEKDAQTIAEFDAAAHWNINFTDYTLVETAQKLQPSGRLDHTFVYERINKKTGLPADLSSVASAKEEALAKEGLYRLKIVVSGDKMTELNHFVKVPEAFNRRYAEMRSANNTIAWAATIIFILLYILIGCGAGLFYLIRKRWYLVKQPMMWATLIAALSVLTSFNQLPFLWMHYQSAISINGFLAQLLLRSLIIFILYSIALTIIIMTAEGLTRAAFGKHPQLWSITQPEVNSSFSIFSRVYGSYLLIGFNCAFVIAFYYLSTTYWGWWSPSEMLFDPNILATYAPWFSPLAMSLNAGFMEECVFRAIPLAGAALLGTYFGKRNWWIGAAFILQAIVFGAAHANYPMQPSYARLIELLFPSLVWGAIYLRYGLLTTIITHTVYDIIWFSLPIFVSQAPHAFTYKIIIIVAALLPLLYVLYARARKDYWTQIPESAFNKAWNPQQIIATQAAPISSAQILTSTLNTRTKKIMLGLGLIGFIVWLCTTPFTHDGVSITLNRNDAINAANTFLQEKNIILNAPWQTLPLMFTNYKQIPNIALQHDFIWKEGNKELYHQLLGNYLHPAHWTIRYAQFDTDIIQRTEEYKVMLYDKSARTSKPCESPLKLYAKEERSSIWNYYHQLAESSAGAQLTQDEARKLARTAIEEELHLNLSEIEEISATSAQLPARRDWFFIFSHPSVYPLQTGQARITVSIAGDEVINVSRMIHVPEEWERTEQHKQNMLSIFVISFILFFMSMLGIALYKASTHKKLLHFSPRLCGAFLMFFMTLSFVDALNSWPNIIGIFNTSLPFSHQIFQMITMLFINSLLRSLVYAAFMSVVLFTKKSIELPRNEQTILLGIGAGLFVAGILSAIQMMFTHTPLWPEYDALSCSLPLLATITNTLMRYMQITIIFSLLFILVDALHTSTQASKMHRIFITLFAILCGMLCIDSPSLEQLPVWALLGAAFGLLLLKIYQTIIRYDYALIPLATGSFMILNLVQQAFFNAYPGAILNNIISACVISIFSAAWYWYASKQC